MWGQLGNSALGSNTLRNSLSENNIPLKLRKKSPARDRSLAFNRNSSPASSVVATHRRVHSPSPVPNQAPAYPPPPIPSSPSPSSLSAASSASSGHSSLDSDSHPLSQRHVERHVGGGGGNERDQKLSTTEGESVSSKTESSATSIISAGTTKGSRKRDTSASETESSGDDDPAGLIQRGGYGRNSLLRSGRCISMPSIVTSQVVTVAISPPATPPPVLRKVAKKGNKTKTSSREEEKSTTTKTSRSSVVASPSPADDSGIYHLEESRTPGEKTTFNFSSEANTPSSGIDVATIVATTVKDKDATLTVPANGNSTRASSQHKRQRDNSQGSGGRGKEPNVNGGGSHERRFRRRFPQVGNEEELVDHYSCALVADILLQGVLYISSNYFAFYSNIFGFKTQFLIPVQTVLKVTKERTVKIIPNAVGIKTEERKYVFGSLLSRDATFKTLLAVWSKVVDPEVISLIEDSETDNTSNAPAQQCSEEELEEFQGPKTVLAGLAPEETELEDTEAGSSVLSASPTSLQFSSLDAKTQDVSVTKGKDPNSPVSSCHWYPGKGLTLVLKNRLQTFNRLPKTSLMLLISTFLLVLLFASASVLIFRIAIVHKRISSAEKPQPEWIYRINAYHDIFKRQNQALSDEVMQLTDRLKETIDQLNKMRRPLEELFASSAFVQGSFCKPSRERKDEKRAKYVNNGEDEDGEEAEAENRFQSLSPKEEDDPWIRNT